jgi:predicted RNase H-like HicB family nuclease
MPIRHYPAIIEAGDEPGYGVFFPDLPGCVSAGDTLQEAALMAAEALELHVAGMIEDGEPLPEPTPLDRIEVEPDIREAARLLVPVELPAARAVRVNVTLDEGLLKTVDRAAARLGYTRSGFLAEAARRMLKAG